MNEKAKFIEITEEQKEKTIIELMKLLKCDDQTADFKFLNESFSSEFGRKKGRTIKNCIIYNKSKTGIKTGKRYTQDEL